MGRIRRGRPRQQGSDTTDTRTAGSTTKIVDRGALSEADDRKTTNVDVGQGPRRGGREREGGCESKERGEEGQADAYA